ncbi:MAG: SDR family oxidoreductase [Spirosomataceae bacterium]
MILITGATGQLGNSIVTNLLKKIPASQIAVLARDEQKATSLAEQGVHVRIGSYQDPASLVHALQGIDTLLLISASDFSGRFEQHKNVIDAAKTAGVKHIFYTGVTLNEINTSPLKPFLSDHFQTEEYIKANGFTYTFLRNGLYAEVIPMFLGANVIETGVFFPASDGKVAFATRQDLAEATATILASEGHENNTYQLTGATAYSFADVAAALSELSGKDVPYVSPEPAIFEATLRQFGLPEPVIQLSALFAAGMKNNDFDTAFPTLEEFLGRKPTDLTTFLKATYGA